MDYISICSPNYLHDSHIRFALRSQSNAICEKPLVLNPWNYDGLSEFEQETGRNVFNVSQVRLHPSIQALREKIMNGPADHIYDITLEVCPFEYFFSLRVDYLALLANYIVVFNQVFADIKVVGLDLCLGIFDHPAHHCSSTSRDHPG